MSNIESYRKNFRLMVEKLFNNWNNLRLAVEHGMGGSNGQQTAIEIMNYIYEYCIENDNITSVELQELVEDLMDEEFSTICMDGSIEEICDHLLKMKQLCLSGNIDLIEQELSKVPQTSDWLRHDVKVIPKSVDLTSDDSDNIDSEMDIDDDKQNSRNTETIENQTEEPGWTIVHRRK